MTEMQLEVKEKTGLPLCFDVEGVKLQESKALVIQDPEKKALEAKAEEIVASLLSVSAEDFRGQEERSKAAEEFGLSIEKASASKSKMLQRPLKDIARQGAEGAGISDSLTTLQTYMEALDPTKIDFEPGWKGRIAGMIPFVGTKLSKYFKQLETADEAIAACLCSLEKSKNQVHNNNVTMVEDKVSMRELTLLLMKQIEVGRLVDQKLQYKLDREIQPEDWMHKFVEEELLFPFRSRVIALQKRLTVNQQGIIAIELSVRGNKDLIRIATEYQDVTADALQVAVKVAINLNDQRIMLKKVNAFRDTSNNIIEGTSRMLKMTVDQIAEESKSSSKDLEALKRSWANVRAATETYSAYKREALPVLAANILEFAKLSEEGEQQIQGFEKGNKAFKALEQEINVR